MLAVAEARPPFVSFERRYVEDREKTLAEGHLVEREVDVALITPVGSKDRFEQFVDEWFPSLAREVDAGRFDVRWLDHYKMAYKAFREGQEPPVDGTPLKQWPAITRGQLQACNQAGLRSIEDLAAANEEALNRLGMGARSLKAQAIAWIDSSRNVGKVAARLSAMEAQLDALKQRNDELEAQKRGLEQQLGAARTTAEASAQPALRPIAK